MEGLDSDKIAALLGAGYPGRIHVFGELDSTNSWLLENGACGDCCLAEKQTCGRGRRGKQWLSPANGNIYLSLRWCFTHPPELLPLLSLLVGISVCKSLHDSGLRGHGLKWPNDILVGENKLAGILVETSNNMQTVVIGLGLNVYTVGSADEQNTWGSLQQFMAHVPDRNDLIASIVNDLYDLLSNLPNLQYKDFEKGWNQWDLLSGNNVSLVQADKKYSGVVQGVDSLGRILLQQEHGKITAFSSAELSLRW